MARGDPQINVRVPSDVSEFLAEQVRRFGSSLSSEVTRVVREKMDREAASAGTKIGVPLPSDAGKDHPA